MKKGVYHVGQVISFRSPNGIVTHRLIKRTAAGVLVTKGDANKTADPGTTTPAQVIGGVVAAPRMLGYWLQYLKNPAGLGSLFMLIVCFWLIYSTSAELAERQLPALARPADRRLTLPSPSSPSAVPLSLYAAAGTGIPVKARTQRTPLSNAAAAQSADRDFLAAGRKQMLNEPRVVFRCRRCGQAFTDTAKLRAHVAEQHADRVPVRQRAMIASQS